MLLAIDIETTGVDPSKDLILEVAWTLVNDDLSQHQILVSSELVCVDIQKAKILADDYVTEMHHQNSLWEDIEYMTCSNLTEIEQLILDDINAGVPKDEPLYLFGASVHFDRSFLLPKMPRLAKRISHRHYDLSTLRMFFRSLNVVDPDYGDDTAHRAADDVVAELAVARAYRGAMEKNFQYLSEH